MRSDKWTRENIAWAAGFIEGEGCITRQITTDRSKNYGYWLLKVTSTDLDCLEKLQSIVGFGSIYTQKTQGTKRKTAWQITFYRQPEVYALLVAIWPFLCARRSARAMEAIAEMSARGPWRKGRRISSDASQHNSALYYQSLEIG